MVFTGYNMPSNNFHTPVLLSEAIKFSINEDLSDHIIVDGTLGGGGYSKSICESLKDTGCVISIDKDLNAIKYARENLKSYNNVITFVNGNFADLKEILIQNNINKISGLVLDLGLSSYQLQHEEGFSFMSNTPLDMRADKRDNLTASHILNTYSRDDLANIFESYGEIGNAQRLAKVISERRKKKDST